MATDFNGGHLIEQNNETNPVLVLFDLSWSNRSALLKYLYRSANQSNWQIDGAHTP